MPGNWITNKQVQLYMNARSSKKTQIVSAAKAGISERSGRDIEKGRRADPRTQSRQWRTRTDPFAAVWDSEILPMLEKASDIQAITVLEHIQDKYPGKYDNSTLRTLQRRIKTWRALHGPDQDVMFPQEHPPGQQGLSDFTNLKGVIITIAGIKLDHLLYHFRLGYSGFSHMKVTIGGESYSALAQGLERALDHLGGTPQEHRTDSLSAAFKNDEQLAENDLTKRYQQLCEHYSMRPTRNNRGKGHENGSVESPHGHVKRRIEQALLVRGSTDFPSIEAYQQFIDDVVSRHNRNCQKKITIEREFLNSLPKHRAAVYSEYRRVVSSSSTIDLRRCTYSVPSRLRGSTLLVRLYDERLECYLGNTLALTLRRVYAKSPALRTRLIDYHHVIDSLMKKPRAFRSCRYRDDLLPDDNYRRIWQYVDQNKSLDDASKYMVKLLYLAAKEDCEFELGALVLEQITQGNCPSIEELHKRFAKRQIQTVPAVNVTQHDIDTYDQLIKSGGLVSHV